MGFSKRTIDLFDAIFSLTHVSAGNYNGFLFILLFLSSQIYINIIFFKFFESFFFSSWFFSLSCWLGVFHSFWQQFNDIDCMFVSNKSFFVTTDRWTTVINDVQHLKLSVADFHIFYRLHEFRFCYLRPTSRIKNFPRQANHFAPASLRFYPEWEWKKTNNKMKWKSF